jgi:hypothetical protein
MADPSWVYIDLGANMSITAATLVWEAAAARDYTLSIAPDGTCAGNGAGCLGTDAPWTTIRTSSFMPSGPRTDAITGLDGVGRYVRMKGTMRTTQYGYSMYDFAVEGTTSTNCACVASLTLANAVASSSNGDNVASHAVDNSTSTRWESVQPASAPNTNVVNPPDPSWIYVDLGTTMELERVVLDWENASAKTYEVQVAPDGTCEGNGAGCLSTSDPWQTLASVTNLLHINHRIDTVSLDGAGRYVRIYATSRTGGYGYSLWNLSVHGSDDVSCEADADAGDAGADASD